MRLSPSALAVLAAATACVNGVDQRSDVHDLRVLGVKTEPPELMSDGGCNFQDPLAFQQAVSTWSMPVTYTALIADPLGGGRPIQYELWACGDPNDLTCADAGQRATLATGTTDAGASLDTEVVLQLGPNGPGTALDTDGGFLLLDVEQNDPYHGLGGIRMPLVLHVKAGTEEIFAQKLMIFSCQFFPDMKPNQNPQLRGFLLGGLPWPEDGGSVQGSGNIQVQADNISDLEESYSVVAFDLSEVHLTESWIIDWYTTLGSFSPDETGGTDFAGNQDPHSTAWSVGSGSPDAGVRFWFVVRDGRGGMSWEKQFLNYSP
jgi:hypothetical protein